MELSITCQQALMVMHRIIRTAAQIDAYVSMKDWAYESITSTFDLSTWDDKKYFDSKFWHNVFALPAEEKELLGFRQYSEKTTAMLVPLWIIRCLPKDFKYEGVTIMGEPVTICHELLDQDTRGGCVACLV